MGEEILRGLRDQLTERRENMVWRDFSLMDRDGSENSKSGFGESNSKLWYLFEKFQIRDDFHIKYHFVNILSQRFEVYAVKNGGYKKFREKMYKTNKIPGNLSTNKTIISKIPFPLPLSNSISIILYTFVKYFNLTFYNKF